MNRQARLGAFVLLGLILFAFATNRVGDMIWVKQGNHVVETEFDDLLGLNVQSSVLMAGVKVGIVQEILLRDHRAATLSSPCCFRAPPFLTHFPSGKTLPLHC